MSTPTQPSTPKTQTQPSTPKASTPTQASTPKIPTPTQPSTLEASNPTKASAPEVSTPAQTSTLEAPIPTQPSTPKVLTLLPTTPKALTQSTPVSLEALTPLPPSTPEALTPPRPAAPKLSMLPCPSTSNQPTSSPDMPKRPPKGRGVRKRPVVTTNGRKKKSAVDPGPGHAEPPPAVEQVSRKRKTTDNPNMDSALPIKKSRRLQHTSYAIVCSSCMSLMHLTRVLTGLRRFR